MWPGKALNYYVPGRIGSIVNAPFTFANYSEMIAPAYVHFFLDTFRIGLIATFTGLTIGYIIAYRVALTRSTYKRKLWIGLLVSMMFLSVLVRVYSLLLTFGPVGFLKSILAGLNPNSSAMTELLVVAGLLHWLIPIFSLTLIGTIQNLNPALVEAAQSLGAPKWVAHLKITIPLSMRGILSAFLIGYTLCISAFVIPLIMGKGKVIFISNIIYSRFSEVANYPSGAAFSIVMLALSLFIIYFVTRLATLRWDKA